MINRFDHSGASCDEDDTRVFGYFSVSLTDHFKPSQCVLSPANKMEDKLILLYARKTWEDQVGTNNWCNCEDGDEQYVGR